MNKSYKFRIYPNEEQRVLMEKTFGCTRFIWNKMLDEKNSFYNEFKKSLSVTPAKYKKEYEWLKEVDSLSLANIQLNLEQAFKNFFKNPKHFDKPNFKSKHTSKKKYKTNCVNGNLKLEEGFIKLPKLGKVKVKQHRDVEGILKSATIEKSASNKYYVCLLYEYHKVIDYNKDLSKSVGIDMSMEHFFVTNEGEKANHPKWYRSSQKKLARAQRKLSKKQIGSNNRYKEKLKVACVK